MTYCIQFAQVFVKKRPSNFELANELLLSKTEEVIDEIHSNLKCKTALSKAASEQQ